MWKHRLQYDLPMAFRCLANEHNVKTATKKDIWSNSPKALNICSFLKEI